MGRYKEDKLDLKDCCEQGNLSYLNHCTEWFSSVIFEDGDYTAAVEILFGSAESQIVHCTMFLTVLPSTMWMYIKPE